MRALKALRRYFLAADDEDVHWSDYAWLAGGFGFPILITIVTII